MIELKDVTTQKKADQKGLTDYSLIVRNGEFCRLGKSEGSMVIRVIVGFLHLEKGYVTFDGMPLSENSASFLRKMIDEAVNSDADIILAVDPTSHQQTLEDAQSIMRALRNKAEHGRVVIVATDRTDI